MRVARQMLIRRGVSQVFHVMSRVVERRCIFSPEEKDSFVRVMKQLENFSGVEILTYCIMDNHFHLLVRIPPERELSLIEAEEVFRRISAIYPALHVESERLKYGEYLEQGMEDLAEKLLNKYRLRMYSLSAFLKDLKQRYTQRYNKLNDRKGNLWEERFKSVLVDGERKSVIQMAAYIDLNPVKAGMVSTPSDYKWSGFGENKWGVEQCMRSLKNFLFYHSEDRIGLNRFLIHYGTILADKIARIHSMGEAHGIRAGDSVTVNKEGVVEFTRGLVIGGSQFVHGFIEELDWSKHWVKRPNPQKLRWVVGMESDIEACSLRKVRKPR